MDVFDLPIVMSVVVLTVGSQARLATVLNGALTCDLHLVVLEDELLIALSLLVVGIHNFKSANLRSTSNPIS